MARKTRKRVAGAVAPPAKNNDENGMGTVLSFRVTGAQLKTLAEIFQRDSIPRVKSTRQFARKIVCDFILGKLHYSNEADRLLDSSCY